MGKITVEQVRKIIEANRDREASWIKAHDVLAGILKSKWNGKKLNKRLATQFKEAMGFDEKAIVYYRHEYGQLAIRVWNVAPFWKEYNDAVDFFIGYDARDHAANINAYNAEAFEDRDICHGGAAKERNAVREEILANPELLAGIVESANAIIDAREKIASAEKAIEKAAGSDHFAIEKLIGKNGA